MEAKFHRLHATPRDVTHNQRWAPWPAACSAAHESRVAHGACEPRVRIKCEEVGDRPDEFQLEARKIGQAGQLARIERSAPLRRRHAGGVPMADAVLEITDVAQERGTGSAEAIFGVLEEWTA